MVILLGYLYLFCVSLWTMLRSLFLSHYVRENSETETTSYKTDLAKYKCLPLEGLLAMVIMLRTREKRPDAYSVYVFSIPS